MGMPTCIPPAEARRLRVERRRRLRAILERYSLFDTWAACHRCASSSVYASTYTDVHRKFHRRLFVLDRQVEALQHDSMWKFGRWLLRRFHDAHGRQESAKAVLDAAHLTRKVLDEEWKAQVGAQLVKPPRM